LSATEVIVLLSIVVPVAITLVLVWVFLRGKKDDPDEQRWRRLAEQRKAAERDER
jgi:multisubunit Na+/H+ antiporter MnhC subunit